jgi:hypothetical protein
VHASGFAQSTDGRVPAEKGVSRNDASTKYEAADEHRAMRQCHRQQVTIDLAEALERASKPRWKTTRGLRVGGFSPWAQCAVSAGSSPSSAPGCDRMNEQTWRTSPLRPSARTEARHAFEGRTSHKHADAGSEAKAGVTICRAP